MSGMLSPIGIVLPPLAETLSLPPEAVAPLFSWLTLGILLGSGLALFVFDFMSLRRWIFLLYVLIALSLLALRLVESLPLMQLVLGAVGTCCGIGLAAAASTITHLYAEDRRASMLVITDGSFSIAGIVVSALAVAMVARGLHWSSAYLAVAFIAACICVLVATAAFPEDTHTVEAGPQAGSRWPLPVWLCIAALFLYTLGQYSLLWWLPSYIEIELGAPREEAGGVVAQFWTGMLIAQLLVAWWVLVIGARRLVIICVIGAFLGSLPLWNVSSPSLLPWLALLWGVGNFGLLKIVIAFATLCVDNPSPRLVAALLFGATSGTAISPALTAALVALSDMRSVLQFGSLCYFALALLVGLAWLVSRGAGQQAPGGAAAISAAAPEQQ
jgi:TsgA-like MFS transporter